jgi:hypothetical protein
VSLPRCRHSLPPRGCQAAADLALPRCRRRRAAARWLVVALLSAVRFRQLLAAFADKLSSTASTAPPPLPPGRTI